MVKSFCGLADIGRNTGSLDIGSGKALGSLPLFGGVAG